MISLLLSVLSSTIILLIFKLFNRFEIQTFQAIVVNYIVCVICGIALHKQVPTLDIFQTPWFPVAVILGCLFIVGFFMAGKTVQYFGVSVGAVVSKMSIAISVTAAFLLFNETVTTLKIIGILLALTAILLVCKRTDIIHFDKRYLLFPVSIFIIGGVNEVLLNYASVNFLAEQEVNLFNISLFGIAACIGIIVVSFLMLTKQIKYNLRDVVAGIFLGIPNYFSIYFLIKALKIDWLGSASIYPIVNVSVISLAALLAWIFLQEKISKINFAGICVAIFAIVLITFGSL